MVKHLMYKITINEPHKYSKNDVGKAFDAIVTRDGIKAGKVYDQPQNLFQSVQFTIEKLLDLNPCNSQSISDSTEISGLLDDVSESYHVGFKTKKGESISIDINPNALLMKSYSHHLLSRFSCFMGMSIAPKVLWHDRLYGGLKSFAYTGMDMAESAWGFLKSIPYEVLDGYENILKATQPTVRTEDKFALHYLTGVPLLWIKAAYIKLFYNPKVRWDDVFLLDKTFKNIRAIVSIDDKKSA